MFWKMPVVGLVLFFCISLAQATVLQGIRYHTFQNKVQIVLDLSQATEFQEFSLASPPRIVLDLPGTTRKGRAGLEINSGSVHGVRTGYRRQDMVRVVIDLNDVAKANIYTLKPEGRYGNRVVVDVYNSSTDALTLTSLPGDQMPYVVFAGKSLDTGTNNGAQVIQVNPHTLPPKAELQSGQTVERKISSSGQVQASTPTVKPDLAKARDIVICLDPGHGGKDPGAHNTITGAKEKNVVLAIGLKLRRILAATPGYKVIMTRSSDIFIPLFERDKICRRAGGDLFISIHADAVGVPQSRQPSGSSVYILSTHGATSQLAKYLAQSENAVDLKWGVKDVQKYSSDMREALLNIQQEATLDSSNVLAKQTLAALSEVGDIHKNSVERANFVVLRSPEIPSMLVETAFISNLKEARKLVKSSYQQQIAEGIAQGVKDYFREHLPQHMLLEK